VNDDTFRRIRDVAVTALVVVLGFVGVSAIGGRVYAELPMAEPQAPGVATQAVVENPHGADPACSACHRTHGAVAGTLLAASQADGGICVSCHDAGGEAPKSTHSNVGYDGATQSPFTTMCTACHDPHADPGTGGNRAMIRTLINGMPVRLFAASGADSYDDGLDDGVYDSLCVACHTTTSHNNLASPELIGQGHGPVGSDCTSCHAHGDDPALLAGFMPAVPPSATPTATETAAPSASPTPTATDTAEPPPEPTATSPPTETPTEAPSATEPATTTPTP